MSESNNHKKKNKMEMSLFIDDLVKSVFTDTPREELTGDTVFMDLESWSSLTAFSLITFIDNTYGKSLMLPDLLQAETIEDLYKIVSK